MNKRLLNKIMMSALLVACIICFFVGLVCGFFGFEYFVFLEPKNVHWLNEMSQIAPDKMWIVATVFWVSGMFTSIVPMTLLGLKFKEMQKNNAI